MARRTGRAEREADVQATLGVALVFACWTTAGLSALDLAVGRSSGVLEARVLVRRGIILYILGRYPVALDDFRASHACTAPGGRPDLGGSRTQHADAGLPGDRRNRPGRRRRDLLRALHLADIEVRDTDIAQLAGLLLFGELGPSLFISGAGLGQ